MLCPLGGVIYFISGACFGTSETPFLKGMASSGDFSWGWMGRGVRLQDLSRRGLPFLAYKRPVNNTGSYEKSHLHRQNMDVSYIKAEVPPRGPMKVFNRSARDAGHCMGRFAPPRPETGQPCGEWGPVESARFIQGTVPAIPCLRTFEMQRCDSFEDKWTRIEMLLEMLQSENGKDVDVQTQNFNTKAAPGAGPCACLFSTWSLNLLCHQSPCQRFLR